MGRFAKDNQREAVDRNQVKTAARPQFAGDARFKQRRRRTSEDRHPPNDHAPIELKYFVLALAALVGLGVGWLSGKAITGWLPPATSSPAVVGRDATPTSEDAGERLQAALPALSPEVAMPQEAVPDDAASPEPNAPAGTVAQAAPDDNQTRVERRIARHGHIRRQARGNVFFRPFKALRKLRIW